MEFNAVYHQASDNYCYPLNEDELIINIKTGYDVKSVSIILGDPFAAGILGGGEYWDGKKEPIIYKKRLKNQIWWTTTVRPEYKRLKYYFELQTEEESWFYFEDGFVSSEQMHLEGRSRQCFVFPWMNPCDVPRTPAWVNDTVWYQIFPDRFCNGDPSNDVLTNEYCYIGEPVHRVEDWGRIRHRWMSASSMAATCRVCWTSWIICRIWESTVCI